MITLGIAHDVFMSSAAIVRDGEVLSAIAEERLNRQKQYRGFPVLALKECLDIAGIDISDISIIAVGWNPTRSMEFPNYRYSNTARWKPEYLYAVPNMILGATDGVSGELVEQIVGRDRTRIHYYDHQLAHAANAFYLSGYDKSSFFCADGCGERETTIWGVASQEALTTTGHIYFPHSIGLMYGAVTQHLGFKPDSDEWKVMALAAEGGVANRYCKIMHAMVDVSERAGTFWLDNKYFSFANPEVYGGRFYTPEFERQFGKARHPNEPIEQRHCDIAYALQHVFEYAMTQLLTHVFSITGEPRLVVSGGCFMNSVYNGKIKDKTPFSEFYVSSCPDDSGISVGAALLAYYRNSADPQFGQNPFHNYWGRSYDFEIPATLDKYFLPYIKLENPSRTAAELIANGKIVGWFQGRMEFGQRALGNRSILADPRDPNNKKRVNKAVKYRESFRPFAPAVLAGRQSEYFIVEDDVQSPYMERVCMFRSDKVKEVPAVVHSDGTGRLQTVTVDANPRFYELIKRFEELTKVPLVLNTSFNVANEPIVCSPTDAIRTFFSSGLDALILGDCLLSKSSSADINH